MPENASRMELDERIALLRRNIAELMEQATGASGAAVEEALANRLSEHIGRRMDFDSEILVRLFWRNQPMRWLPVRVHYPLDGISHFQLWRDNWLISKMHARLFFGMLWRAPRLLWRRYRQ